MFPFGENFSSRGKFLVALCPRCLCVFALVLILPLPLYPFTVVLLCPCVHLPLWPFVPVSLCPCVPLPKCWSLLKPGRQLGCQHTSTFTTHVHLCHSGLSPQIPITTLSSCPCTPSCSNLRCFTWRHPVRFASSLVVAVQGSSITSYALCPFAVVPNCCPLPLPPL